MKITMYELLGMIKDGKIPKKIKFNEDIYTYHDKEHGYCKHHYDNTYICINSEYYLFDILDDEVEILEEEKKIPEKLYGIVNPKEGTEKLPSNEQLMFKINEIIDYLKSKGDE